MAKRGRYSAWHVVGVVQEKVEKLLIERRRRVVDLPIEVKLRVENVPVGHGYGSVHQAYRDRAGRVRTDRKWCRKRLRGRKRRVSPRRGVRRVAVRQSSKSLDQPVRARIQERVGVLVRVRNVARSERRGLVWVSGRRDRGPVLR